MSEVLVKSSPSPLTTPNPTNSLSKANKKELPGKREKERCQGIERRVGEEGKGREGRRGPLPVTYYLRCPFCFGSKTEIFLLRKIPSHLGCGRCGKVVPTDSWLVRGFTNLQAPPVEFRGWEGKIVVDSRPVAKV